MGSSGASSQVVKYVPTETSAAATEPVVTPAVAKTISRDTESAQQAQLRERQRMFGISSTYANLKKKSESGGSGSTTGNATLGGS